MTDQTKTPLLSDERISELWNNEVKRTPWNADKIAFARAIESAVREALAAQPAPAGLTEAVEHAYSEAYSAIGYVGASNYASREREAKQRLRDAFKPLRAALTKQEGSAK